MMTILKREITTCRFIRLLHTPLVSEVQLNESGAVERKGTRTEKRGSVPFLEAVQVRHNEAAGYVH